MTESKIVAKPFKHGDEVSKSRNLTGMDEWARSSRFVGVIMMILGWFCIPFEVILRRDFGQRWFTFLTFCAGFLQICIFSALQSAYNGAATHMHHYFSWLGSANPFHNLSDYSYRDMENNNTFLQWMTLLYFFMGLYHLFKIKWRSQANIPLHSFDDGTSRLGWFAGGVMYSLNIFSAPLMAIYWLFLPRSQRRGKPFPKLITDERAFTNVVFEPLVVFVVAWILTTAMFSVWLYLACISMVIHGHWREMARKTKALDFQDSRLEAAIMRDLRKSQAEKAPKEKKKPVEQPKPEPPVAVHYPNLSEIIEEMNMRKQPAQYPGFRPSNRQ